MAKAIVSRAAHPRLRILVPSSSRLHDPCSMRLIAPSAFKGTMSPLQAAQFLGSPRDRLLPLSDGGDGFIECLQQELGCELSHASQCCDSRHTSIAKVTVATSNAMAQPPGPLCSPCSWLRSHQQRRAFARQPHCRRAFRDFLATPQVVNRWIDQQLHRERRD